MPVNKFKLLRLAVHTVVVVSIAGCSAQPVPPSTAEPPSGQEQAVHGQPQPRPDDPSSIPIEASSSRNQISFQELLERADALGHVWNPERESIDWVIQNGDSFVLSAYVRDGADLNIVTAAWSSGFDPSETWAVLLDQENNLSGVTRVISDSRANSKMITECQIVGDGTIPLERWKEAAVGLQPYVDRPIETWIKSLLGDRLLFLETQQTATELDVFVEAKAGTRSLSERKREVLLITLGLTRYGGRLVVHYSDLSSDQFLVTEVPWIRSWAATNGIPVMDESLVSVGQTYGKPILPTPGTDRGMGSRAQVGITTEDLVRSSAGLAGELQVTHAGVYTGGRGRLLMASMSVPSTEIHRSPLSPIVRDGLTSIFANGDNLLGVVLVRRAGNMIQTVEIQRKDWLALDTLQRLKPDLDFDALGFLPFRSTIAFTCDM